MGRWDEVTEAVKEGKRRYLKFVDDGLTENVVEPLAKAGRALGPGFEEAAQNVGAAIATVPATIAEYGTQMVPTDENELAMRLGPQAIGKGVSGVRKVMPDKVAQGMRAALKEKFGDKYLLIEDAMRKANDSWNKANPGKGTIGAATAAEAEEAAARKLRGMASTKP